MCLQEKDKLKQWNDWHAQNKHNQWYRTNSPRRSEEHREEHRLHYSYKRDSEILEVVPGAREAEGSDGAAGRFKRFRTVEPDQEQEVERDGA